MLQAVNDKYERFQRAGASLVRIESDWDDTLGIGTWPIIRKVIGNSGRRVQKDLYKYYGSLVEKGTLPYIESDLWQRMATAVLTEERLEPILDAVRENEGGVKEGARELYEYCRSKSIPFIIKTASIAQVVRAAAEAGGIQPDLVIATVLKTCDKDCTCGGVILGWEGMTHIRDKNLAPPTLTEIERDRPYAIGIGDGTFDRTMISPDKDTLWIRANSGCEYMSDRWGQYIDDSFSGLRLFDEGKVDQLFTEYPPYDLVSIEPDIVASNIMVREMLGENQ